MELFLLEQVVSKLKSIMTALFYGSGNCSDNGLSHENDLTESLETAAHFTKAWVQLTFLDHGLCNNRVLCEANTLANTEMKRIMAETLR